MKALSTIVLAALAAFLLACAIVLTVDGNLARILGWYRFEAGRPLFTEANTSRIDKVNWMRISDLHDRIECERDEEGIWWIITPFRDRMSQEAVAAILAFTSHAKLVDTLPLSTSTDEKRSREFGVDSSPHTITLKVPTDEQHHTTIARYTLGSTAPWLADAGDGKNLIRTTYLRTDYYSDDERIHVVSGNILDIFRNGLYALRDPKPLRIDPRQVQALRISRPDAPEEKTLEARRLSPELPWNLVKPVITQANQDQVNNLLAALSTMTALRVDDARDITLPEKAQYCIELEVASADGTKTEQLLLYPPFKSASDDQQLCYARVADRPVVFTLEAEPRVRRHGPFANIIAAVCKAPVLPDKDMAQLLSGSGVVYTSELPLSLEALRSMRFADVDEKDVSSLMLLPSYGSSPLLLRHIPGNAESGVQDVWLYSAEGKPFAEAEHGMAQALVTGLSNIPVDSVLEDIPLGGDKRAAMKRYGLDNPDYTLVVLPTPCLLRATLYGLDLPLIRDRSPRTFYVNRWKDPQTGRSCWAGMEKNGNSICRLSSKFTRLFSLQNTRWKSRTLFHFPLSALRRLTLGFQKEPLELEYDYIGDAWTGKLNGEDVTPRINPHRAVFYVRQLQKLRVDQWLERGDPDAVIALSHPAFYVKLDLEITDYSSAEAIVIDQADDVSASGDPIGKDQLSNKELAEKMLTEGDATDDAMRQLALAELPVIRRTLTLEIVPSAEASDRPFFYGRIRETGELFILNFNTAQSLAGSILDM